MIQKFRHSFRIVNFKFQITRRLAFLFIGILVMGGLVLVLWANRFKKAEAAWIFDGWAYRQNVQITNNTSAQTNYQVQVVLGTGDLVVAGKMRSDCGDVRFTDYGGTPLQYWNEYCFSASGKSSSFWVTIPSLAAGNTSIYVYYGNSAATAVSVYSSVPTGINIGTGNDGACSVSSDTVIDTGTCVGAGTADAINTTVSANTTSGQNTVVVAANTGLAVGDEILIINLQRTSGSTANVGQFETERITNINGTTLTLNHNLTNGYDGTTQKIMVQRVPNYSSVTVNTGINFTPTAWNGTKNGVMMFRASGTVTATGNIHANGKGYRGGAGGASGWNGGVGGESYDGTTTGRGGSGSSHGESIGGGRDGGGALASPNDGTGNTRGGGGGGGSTLQGASSSGAGGGGGGGYIGGGGGGGAGGDTQGSTINGGAGGTGGAAAISAGGGGGGCGVSPGTNIPGAGGAAGSAGNDSNCASAKGKGGEVGSGTTMASGGGGANGFNGGGGGGGGGTYGVAALTTLYLGSGGGGGGSAGTSHAGTDGNIGGGIVYIGARTVTITGTVAAKGNQGASGASGGGGGGSGAGGSLLINAGTATVGSSLATATGGAVSSVSSSSPGGGAGGAGVVAVNYSNSDGPTTNPAATTSVLPFAAAPASEENAVTLQPVAYWRFDEGQGTSANDSTANKNLGTLSGTTKPTWQSSDQCIAGKCLFFDGTTSYVAGGNNASEKVTGSITLSAWVRLISNNAVHDVISKTGASGQFAYRLYTDASGLLNMEISDDGSGSGGHLITATGVTTLSNNTWYFVSGVFTSGTSVSVFVNGKLDGPATTTSVTSIKDSSESVAVGDELNSGTAKNYMKGFIDEAKIYNYARSSGQIYVDYNAKGGDSARGGGAILGSAANSNLASGLVGYWKMDETSWTQDCSTATATDTSGNGNSGKSCPSTTGPTTTANGKFGYGGSFDGTNDNLAVSAATSLNGTSFSIGGWFKPTSLQVQGFASKNDYANSWRLFMDDTSGHMEFDAKSDSYNLISNTALVAGQWAYVAATFDANSNTMKIYINGVLDNTLATGADIGGANNTAVVIGALVSSGTTPFAGTIDEVRMYNRALAPSEVAQLYSFAPGPVGYWNFEEGSGTAINDSSGNAITGTAQVSGRFTQGKYGKAGNFDGTNDYVSLGTSTTLSLQTQSLSSWIYLSAHVTNGTSSIIFSRSNTISSGGYEWGIRGTGAGSTSQSLALAYYDGSVEGWYVDGTALNLNQWYHVEGVWDKTGGRVYFYINGVLSSAVTTTTGTITNVGGDTALIGRQPDNSNFNGYLDNVAIYNYARNSSQIIEDMNGGHPSGGSPVGSAADWWKFDEGQGTVANDSGTQRIAGTLTSMSTAPSSVGISGWNPNGKFGKAVSFDGSDDLVDFGDMAWTEGISTMSATFWVNPTTLATAKCLLCKYNNATSERSWAIRTDSSDQTMIRVNITTATNEAGTTFATTPTGVLTAGVWAHVAVVYDGGQVGNVNRLKVYVNGIKQNLTFSGTIPSALQATASNLRAGAYSDGTSFTAMTMDEIKLYASALTDATVKIDYNHSSGINFGALGASTFDGRTASNSAGTAFCVPGDTSTCNTPKAEWLFEEGSGTTINDTSGNGQTGTAQVTGRFASGYAGKAGNFDGAADYVDVGDFANTEAAATLSWEFWVNPTAVAVTKCIFCKYNNAASQRSWAIETGTTNASAIRVTVPTATNEADGTTYGETPTGQLTAGAWTHVTVVYDGSQTGNSNRLKIYINGKILSLTFAGTIPATTQATTSNARLGASSDASRFFNGKIDSVRVFTYARSVAQVAWDYNRGLPLTWLKMDDCQGTTLHDSAATGSATLTVGSSGTITSAGDCGTTATTTWNSGKTGKFNYSIKLDGTDDYGSVSNPSVILGNQSESVWIKTSTSGQQGITEYANAAPAPASATYDRALRLTSNNFAEFKICNADASTCYLATGVTALNDGNWHHLVGVFDGTNAYIYVDGKSQAQIAAAGGRADLTTPKYNIGVATNLANNAAIYFNGQIDDVKLFNYALTQYQVRTEFNQGAAVRFGPSTGAP